MRGIVPLGGSGLLSGKNQDRWHCEARREENVLTFSKGSSEVEADAAGTPLRCPGTPLSGLVCRCPAARGWLLTEVPILPWRRAPGDAL